MITEEQYHISIHTNDGDCEVCGIHKEKQMSHSLVIWEKVPEETDLYLIPNAVLAENPQYEEFLKEAHGHMIGARGDDDNQGLKFLNHALSSGDKYEIEDGFEEKYHGVLAQYKVQREQPLVNQNITHVYFAGLLL